MLVNYEALVMLAIIIAGSWLINRPLNAVVPHAACHDSEQQQWNLCNCFFPRSCRRMDQFLIYL